MKMSSSESMLMQIEHANMYEATPASTPSQPETRLIFCKIKLCCCEQCARVSIVTLKTYFSQRIHSALQQMHTASARSGKVTKLGEVPMI